MKTFTVFCTDKAGTETIWISSVEANDTDQAAKIGKSQCAEDWQQDENTVHVLGIAKGDVEILEWNDL